MRDLDRLSLPERPRDDLARDAARDAGDDLQRPPVEHAGLGVADLAVLTAMYCLSHDATGNSSVAVGYQLSAPP